MPVGGKCAPHIPPSESYQYLGVQVNLELDWGDQWGAVLKKVSEEAGVIAGCGGTTTQKIKLVEMVMRPAMRYSMAVVPYTWAQIQSLHSALMNCVRRSCGLSRYVSTLLMMADRESFGIGVDSAFHTYVYTLAQATEDLLADPGDRGGMARGLWRTHEKVGACDTESVQPRVLAQLPTLTARTQLAQLGIT
eukprot:1189660-Prorocentrum_minimum.AAC.3